ncbi:type II toxin-antitoxin system VapC family toxin [Roseofilum reptotaenium CS-1145]|uniref:type II toxin-antitoxin system VapC family toxin n=1 Tax=Roseofilum reptotaenium TaxID=1233427 RepID=UPI000B239199|nr:type II toxin-antitoxin system VapC family toxin [Roseofilum reptotaenium]MDB9519686.1 type II toxin-antitoxin system VapC family toxin [Roseofilum reptotaenium CS-1145]
MNVVIDANLLVVLVHEESRSQRVRNKFNEWIRDDVKIHAPNLVQYEVANALTRLVSANSFPQQQLAQAWILLNRLTITYHDLSEGTRIIEIALSLKRQSAYDASYIALAETLDAVLWTLDTPLYRNSLQYGFPVHLVE